MYEVLHFNPKIMEQLTLKQCICVRVDYSVFFFRDKSIPSDTDQQKENKFPRTLVELWSVLAMDPQ